MPSDDEILAVKELCDLLRLHPSTVYKLIRQDKDSELPSRQRMAHSEAIVIERWTVEQSMNAQRLRKAIEPGVNGEDRHRRSDGRHVDLATNSRQ